MQLTLKNARRLDTTVRAKIQDLLMEGHQIHSITVSTTDDMNARIDTARQKVIESTTAYARLSSIRHAMRRAIEVKNENSGINELMNQEAQTREIIQMLEINISFYSRPNGLLTPERLKTLETRLGNLRKAAETATDSVSDEAGIQGIMTAEYVDEVKTEIRRLYNVLNDLKDRCAFANSDPKNSIRLADGDVEFLTQLRLM